MPGDRETTQNAPTQAERISIETPDGPMPAHLWRPAGGEGPGLVLVQEIFGVSDYVRTRGADLAALGYVVCAPEVYWRLDDVGIDSTGDVLEQAMALAQQVDWDTAVADVGLALSHLRGQIEVTGGTGLIGFCFGGGLAFAAAAAADPDVLVSYYGSALPGLLDLAERVSAPSLHHFGLSDAYLPPDQVERIRTAVAGPDVWFETYPGAGHAFDNPDPMFHDADASATAWTTTTRFLAQTLPVGPA